MPLQSSKSSQKIALMNIYLPKTTPQNCPSGEEIAITYCTYIIETLKLVSSNSCIVGVSLGKECTCEIGDYGGSSQIDCIIL